jgi:hypothetical protein
LRLNLPDQLRFPNFGVHMNLQSIALALLLWPIPAAVQGIGSVTLLEGSLKVVRGTSVLHGAEGMRFRQGDIIESSDGGFVQLEFVGGAIVALGPSSRLYIFRHDDSGGKAGSNFIGADLILLSGWLKGESINARSYRYETPLLAATTGNGTVVVHGYEGRCDVFVESGSAAIGEVSPDGSSRQPGAAKAGQFFSRRSGANLANFPRPNSAFLDAMPRPFRDTLPSRLAHTAGKAVEPRTDHQVSYLEIQSWLTMPSAWRRGFVDRFAPRLKDAEFRKQLEVHVAEFPEWDEILHPENPQPETPPAPVPNPKSPQPRV